MEIKEKNLLEEILDKENSLRKSENENEKYI